MGKSRLTDAQKQLRKSVSVLKKAGLYKPVQTRGAPTDYAKRLVSKYRDVVAGKAHVVSVTPEAAKKFADNYRVARRHVIVPKDTLTDKIRFSKKTGELIKTRKVKGGSWKVVGHPATALSEVPELKKNQTYMIPFRQGRDIEFQTRADIEELARLIASYEERQKNAYKNILKYLQIGTFVPDVNEYAWNIYTRDGYMFVVMAETAADAVRKFLKNRRKYKRADIIKVELTDA